MTKQYTSVEQVFDDFMKEEITYLEAVEILINQFDFESIDAENRVESWEN